MARIKFDAIFLKHNDGSLEPKAKLRVGGVVITPGVKFTRGVAFSGIDFTQFIDHDLEVETDGDTFVIKGIY